MAGHLIIRADASTRIGAGHLMRCFALASQWQQTAGKVTCVSYCDNERLKQRIAHQGMAFVSINTPHPHPADLQTLRAIIQGETSSVFVVLDGYHFDPDFQKAICAAKASLLVIDDLAHQEAYHAHLILNQNAGAESLTYPCSPHTECLLGTTYALLRPEFLNWKTWRRDQTRETRNVLVTLGGGDRENATAKVLTAIAKIRVPDLVTHAVVGPSNPHTESLKQIAKEATCEIQLLSNVSDMAREMAWADVAVSAGGSTCWELAFMQLPTLIITLADNQILGAQTLHRQGVAIHLGWHSDLTAKEITGALTDLLRNTEERIKISERGRAMVDGDGAARIVDKMLTYGN